MLQHDTELPPPPRTPVGSAGTLTDGSAGIETGTDGSDGIVGSAGTDTGTDTDVSTDAAAVETVNA